MEVNVQCILIIGNKKQLKKLHLDIESCQTVYVLKERKKIQDKPMTKHVIIPLPIFPYIKVNC